MVLDAKGQPLDLEHAAPATVPMLGPTVLVVPPNGVIPLRDLHAAPVTVLLLPPQGTAEKAVLLAAGKSRDILEFQARDLHAHGLRIPLDLTALARKGEHDFVLALSIQADVHMPRCC